MSSHEVNLKAGSAALVEIAETDWKLPDKLPRKALLKFLPEPLGGCSAEEVLLQDVWRAALHETAHVVVARHFGLAADALLLPVPRRSAETKAVIGQTHYPPTTSFRLCCLAWAGPIADCVELPSGLLEEDLQDIFDSSSDMHLSETDRDGIAADPRTWRACITAHRILLKSRHQLTDYARHLVSDFWRGIAV